MDFLNGTQLKAFSYLLAVHEIAIAYHGESDLATRQPELQDVLSTSDLCAVGKCRREIDRPTTARQEFAWQQVVGELKPNSELNLRALAWSLLAKLLAHRQAEAADYITQKLPLTEARLLRDLIANSGDNSQAPAFDLFLEDSRRMAANLTLACSEKRSVHN